MPDDHPDLDDIDSFAKYLEGAKQGDAESQNRVGVHCSHGYGVEESVRQAFEWYAKAAEQGHNQAQYNLAICYGEGFGLEKDYAQAKYWYGKVAAIGNVKAQFRLAELYDRGSCTESNYNEAFKWYRMAVEKGYYKAQFRLGVCYYRGRGVEQDLDRAIDLFKKVMNDGKTDSEDQNGDVCDEDQAAEWFAKAANQVQVVGRYNLAISCLNGGKGLKPDRDKAIHWLEGAAKWGHVGAPRSCKN